MVKFQAMHITDSGFTKIFMFSKNNMPALTITFSLKNIPLPLFRV
jgi:hypothetical protein